MQNWQFRQQGVGYWVALALFTITTLSNWSMSMAGQDVQELPAPRLDSGFSLEQSLAGRRTQRAFDGKPVSLKAIAQLLWAAQGTSNREGLRTAPSAGALYPLELHLLAGNVEGLDAGLYRYDAEHHHLTIEQQGDLRSALAEVALNQDWISQSSAVVIVSAVVSRTSAKYGERAARYVHMEVGHASQNLLLQATALGLGSAIVGAFDDEPLAVLLGLPEGEQPLIILPLGR